jgi:hypothetical protein
MSKIILPNAYLPPVYWWVFALHHKSVLLENQETYPKQTYRNRCYIYSANGILQLNIPVKKVYGNHTRMADIEIDNTKNWRSTHWRSIESAYNKTPYFLYYKDNIRPFFETEYKLLSSFNYELIHTILSIFKASKVEISLTQDYMQEPQSPEFRTLLQPKVPANILGISTFPRYIQAFEPRNGFLENLSIIDLIFNLGPDSIQYINKVYTINFNEQVGS